MLPEGEGCDTEGVIEGSRGCEPQTDPACSQVRTPGKATHPRWTLKGSQMTAKSQDENHGKCMHECAPVEQQGRDDDPRLGGDAMIWDPSGVLPGSPLSGGAKFWEHVGSVWGSHPRLPSTTPSVSPPSPHMQCSNYPRNAQTPGPSPGG